MTVPGYMAVKSSPSGGTKASARCSGTKPSGSPGAVASLDVERANGEARRIYERLGYVIIRQHEHRWRSIDPVSGAILASGTSDMWTMRKELV